MIKYVLQAKIDAEILRLERERDGLHYHAGTQFDSDFNCKIAALNWVLKEMKPL